MNFNLFKELIQDDLDMRTVNEAKLSHSKLIPDKLGERHGSTNVFLKNRLLMHWKISCLLFSLSGAFSLYAQNPSADLLQQRKAEIADALLQTPAVIRLTGTNASQSAAQAIALQDTVFLTNTIDRKSGQPFLNEIFGVYPARESDLPATFTYAADRYYKVELYNFALNLTTLAFVDLKNKKVIHRAVYKDSQPDIPDRLKQLGLYLAVNSSQVEKALGFKPTKENALMSDTKTSLNNTHCERSMHLCVAPTFTYKDKALWVIVDLTDLRVAGVRWTYTGKDEPLVTERSMANKNISECYCQHDTLAVVGNWKINFMLTSSDGLRIADVSFKNKPVIEQAKLVDWHVSYSNTDGFGYSDAVGCPVFSQSAVIAVNAPFIDTLYNPQKKILGFRLRQQYWSRGWPASCNYQYEQRYEFFNDGSWRFAVASLGRGCGNNGTYRPVLRIVFAGEQQNFFQYNGNNEWKQWKGEQWYLQNELTKYTAEKYLFKISTGVNSGYYLEPGLGQFADSGRGDFAYTYVTLHNRINDEGDADMPTIGPCCNDNYHQGPDKYLEPVAENIEGKKLVLWYVPQMKNDDTPGKEYCWAENYVEEGLIKTRIYPCFAGPLFVPVK